LPLKYVFPIDPVPGQVTLKNGNYLGKKLAAGSGHHLHYLPFKPHQIRPLEITPPAPEARMPVDKSITSWRE